MKGPALVLLALSVCLASGSLAQTSLSPEDAVALALERNQSLAAVTERVSAAEGLRVQAGLKPNPRLIFQSENLRFTDSPPFQYWRDTANFAYLSQVIESGSKRQSRIDLAEANVHASELSVSAQRADLAGRVLVAYWHAAGDARFAKVLSEAADVLERIVQYHRDRVREGSLAEADLMRVELERQQASVNFMNAQQTARGSLLLLFREMGVPEIPNTTLTGDIAAIAPVPDEVEPAVERRFDLKLAAQSVQQAQSAAKLQQANARPDVEVLFGYKRTAGLDTLLGGLQFNLPFRNRNQGAIAAAVADQAAAAAALRAAQTAARTEIQSLREEYEQKKELAEKILPAMRERAAEMSRIADAVYREGASDLLRLLDAERVRIQTESLSIRTLLEYRLAAVKLQIALGLAP